MTMSAERILVIDDELSVIRFCQRALEEAGFEVTGALNGEEGLQLLRERRPARPERGRWEPLEEGGFDLTLLDVMLPDLDGLDVLSTIQEMDPEMAVVIVTGHGTMEVAIRALKLGAQDFLLKPFTSEELLAAVQEVLDKKRLIQENLRLRARLPILEIGKALMSEVNLERLTQLALETVRQTLGADRVSLMLLDEERQELSISAALGLPDEVVTTTRVQVGQGLAGLAAQRREPILLPEQAENDFSIQALLPRSDTGSTICMPLMLKDRVLGVLNASRPLGVAPFRQDDVDLLSILGGQVAVAIENARLYQETARRLKETETLGAVTASLTRSLDLDQVLRSIVVSATRLVPASISGVIHLVDEAARKLVPQATSAPGVNIEQKLEMSIGEGIAGRVVQEKRLINVPNVEEDPHFLITDTAIPKQSLLTVPLLIDGDCIGTLSLNSDQVGAFSGDDERLLTTLAAQAAVAVRNAGLHQEVQRWLEELTFLNRIGRAVTSSLNLEQVLMTVMEETAVVLRTEAVSILLLDEENSELVFEAAVGSGSERMKGRRFPLGQGIAGWVAREGQRLLVPDVREDPRFYPGIDEATGFVTRSILAVPLRVKGRVLGVIEAVNQTEGYFDQADVASLSSMAQWAAIAIENARLFEQAQWEIAERKRAEEALRRRNEELMALNAIATTLGQSLDLDHILRATLDKVLEVIEMDAGWIQLLDEDASVLSLFAHRGFSQEMAKGTKAIKLGESMTGKVAQSGQPIVLDKVSEDLWLGMETSLRETLHAFAGVPIKSKDKVLGVLGVFSRSPRPRFAVDSQEVQLLTAIGHQIGVTIENVRLAEKASEIEILRELNRLRSELIANVSHELRTPVGLIKIFCTTLLREDVEFDREIQREFLCDIEDEANRLETIVDNLLDLSRMRDGRLRLDRCLTDVGQLAREVKEAMEVQLTQHRFVHDFPSDPLVATVDPKRIEQVLRNLLSNAIKYSPEGGTITIQGRGDERQLLVRVSDQGIGIPSEDLERVFERFYRVENEITKTVRGVGLGLAVCQGIVKAHGGRIWVESTLGAGSTFSFTLPVLSKATLSPVEGPKGPSVPGRNPISHQLQQSAVNGQTEAED
jgi:GAF domain-containing protein/CheY-like chemotaxis protein